MWSDKVWYNVSLKNSRVIISLISAYLGPKLKTAEGLDCVFATNYLGHFLLTKTILDNMKNTGNDNIRIVTLLSDSITKSQINFDDIMYETDKANYDIYKVFNIFDFYFSLTEPEIGKNIH